MPPPVRPRAASADLQPTDWSVLGGLISAACSARSAIASRTALFDELHLQRREEVRRSATPGCLKGRATQQGRLLPVEVRPHGRGLTDPAEHDQLAAVVLDPLPQPRPLPDQRLVRDLHSRHPRLRVHVEREQPGSGPAVHDLAGGRQFVAAARRRVGSPSAPTTTRRSKSEWTCPGRRPRATGRAPRRGPRSPPRCRPAPDRPRVTASRRDRDRRARTASTAAPAALPAPPSHRRAPRRARARRCDPHAAPARRQPPRPRPGASPGWSRSCPGPATERLRGERSVVEVRP